MNLDNQFEKAKATHNRNEKNANNGMRAAILFSASEVVICVLSNQTGTNVSTHMPGVALKRLCRAEQYISTNYKNGSTPWLYYLSFWLGLDTKKENCQIWPANFR